MATTLESSPFWWLEEIQLSPSEYLAFLFFILFAIFLILPLFVGFFAIIVTIMQLLKFQEKRPNFGQNWYLEYDQPLISSYIHPSKSSLNSKNAALVYLYGFWKLKPNKKKPTTNPAEKLSYLDLSLVKYCDSSRTFYKEKRPIYFKFLSEP